MCTSFRKFPCIRIHGTTPTIHKESLEIKSKVCMSLYANFNVDINQC